MAELATAHAVIGICYTAGQFAKKYIDLYKNSEQAIRAAETGLLLATDQVGRFYQILPMNVFEDSQLKTISRVFEVLQGHLETLGKLLQDYHDRKVTKSLKLKWTFFGVSETMKVATELKSWNTQLNQFFLISLVTVQLKTTQNQLNTQQMQHTQRSGGGTGEVRNEIKIKQNESTNVQFFVDESVRKTFEGVPGFEKAIVMKTAVAANEWASRNRQYSPGNTIQFTVGLGANLEFAANTFTVLKHRHSVDPEMSFWTLSFNSQPMDVILEHRYFESEGEARINTAALAQILYSSEPKYSHIPNCLGFFRNVSLRPSHKGQPRFNLVFPRRFQVGGERLVHVTDYSLASGIKLLQSDSEEMSTDGRAIVTYLSDLSSRTELAKQLIRAVAYIHALGWVHKGLRSSKILLGLDEHGNIFPLVVGFDQARPTAPEPSEDRIGYTGIERYADWDNIVYRHPKRWDRHPTSQFRPSYDVYSLGVILLELGLRRLASEMAPEPRLDIDRESDAQEVIRKFKSETARLKAVQGETYRDVVTDCFDRMVGSADRERCQDSLSKWVSELNATRY